jgi:hypothetical protein
VQNIALQAKAPIVILEAIEAVKTTLEEVLTTL